MVHRVREHLLTRARSLVAFLAVTLLASHGASAAAVPTRTGLRVPAPITLDDAELLVRFTDLDRQLEGTGGRQLRAMLDQLGLFSRTAESWRTLGDALGLGPEEAIGALLGDRFMLIADGLGEQDELRWACVMSTDPELGSRIPRLLKAAPRGSLGGRTVFAIEDGSLSVMPINREGTLLAVATRGADTQLRAAAKLAGGWATPDTTPAPGGMIVLQRPGQMIYGTIRPQPDGWDIAFSAAGPGLDASLGEAVVSGNGPARIDNGWYDRVTSGAGIAYAGPIEVSVPRTGRGAEGSIGPAEKTTPGSGIFSLDLQNIRKWATIFLPFPPPPGFLRGEADYGLLAAGPDDRGSMWLRVPDAPTAAKTGDAYVCDLLGDLAGDGVVSTESPECTGRFPAAGRRVSLPPAQGESGGGRAFAWGISRVETAQSGPDTWWSMHAVERTTSEGTGSGVPSLAPGLSDDPNAPATRVTIRPKILLDRLKKNGGVEQALITAAATGTGLDLAAIERIALIDCSVVPPQVEGGPAQGVLRLRFVEEEAPVPPASRAR